jgi:hypothetical protein
MSSQNKHNFEELLRRRAQSASAMPWLEMRVNSHVEWREQAKAWLREHPGGLSQKLRQPLRLRVATAVCTLTAARTWPLIGIALAVVCTVYLMTRMTLFAPAMQTVAKYGGIYVLGAVLMVLATALVNWPRLRQFYG